MTSEAKAAFLFAKTTQDILRVRTNDVIAGEQKEMHFPWNILGFLLAGSGWPLIGSRLENVNKRPRSQDGPLHRKHYTVPLLSPPLSV